MIEIFDRIVSIILTLTRQTMRKGDFALPTGSQAFSVMADSSEKNESEQVRSSEGEGILPTYS